MNSTILLIAIALVVVVLFLTMPARRIATLLRAIIPGLMIMAGVLLVFSGRIGMGLFAIIGGIVYAWRRRGVGSFGPASGGANRSTGKSSVRSAALEMELDHETGAMNGIVLAGQYEGQLLDDLAKDDLLALWLEISSDSDSAALLDAYLDRRFPGWREDAHFDGAAGQGGAASAGPMDEEEAYEVLGLAPGASLEEIRSAHRRLMKGLHPDSGGSTFLAAKINEAKDILLKSHS